ncbi:MAG: hypothetical protein Q4G04_00495 [bacterium]|nr:hypothetical protein [bacterium]
MMLKVFDLLRNIGWYIVSFIYDLIDTLLDIIKKLNAFDIINSLSDNQVFRKFYTGAMAIAVTLFALFIIWKFVNKLLDPDDEITIKNIVMETVKCGLLIMLSTFLFVQVSNFSITLSNYTGNIFESNTKGNMSNSMLTMFVSYKDGYKNSDKFSESKTVKQVVEDGSFDSDELYLAKYVTKAKIIFADDKDYKYEINWIMAIICGGFFLYSLFFAGIMLGRRQIEFLFLFTIAPIVFATSVCNKQRRGAVIEQLVSLALQSAVVMLIVSLSVLVMQEINATTFFTGTFQNIVTKTLLYLGCATFIMTGSQVINRFIGSNVSAASGREQLMSLMGYGKMAGIGATVATGAAVGGTLLGAGVGMKAGKAVATDAMSRVGMAMGMYGMGDSASGGQTSRMQDFAKAMGTKLHTTSQKWQNRETDPNKFSASDAFMNAGANSINNTVRKVMPRASYNSSYYRRKNMI